MLKKVLLVFAAAVAALAIYVATRPDAYRVVRSVTVAAPAAFAYEQVADFHRWEPWNPFGKQDPAMKSEYGGAASGTGATYHWVGTGQTGEGRMTITDAKPGAEVVIRLDFLKPMEDTATVTFSFEPDGAGTRVSWAMAGKYGFVGKAMCLVKDMDAMIGPMFEQGLASLKKIAEAEAAKVAAAPKP